MTVAEATADIAELAHVAGTVEREPADNEAGWIFTQRCLRCDRPVYVDSYWWPLGATVYELSDGRMTTEPAPTTKPDQAERCHATG